MCCFVFCSRACLPLAPLLTGSFFSIAAQMALPPVNLVQFGQNGEIGGLPGVFVQVKIQRGAKGKGKKQTSLIPYSLGEMEQLLRNMCPFYDVSKVFFCVI